MISPYRLSETDPVIVPSCQGFLLESNILPCSVTCNHTTAAQHKPERRHENKYEAVHMTTGKWQMCAVRWGRAER